MKLVGRMRILQAILFATAVSACSGAGSVRYTARAEVTTPELIEVEPGVRVVADYDEPVFYNDGFYWRYEGGVWYRSPYYNRSWIRVSTVPLAVRRIERPERYVHYRATARVAPVRREYVAPVRREYVNREIREEREEARERREEHRAARELRHDQRQLARDRAQIRQDRREIARDRARDDRREYVRDRRELQRDKRELARDKQELRDDRRRHARKAH